MLCIYKCNVASRQSYNDVVIHKKKLPKILKMLKELYLGAWGSWPPVRTGSPSLLVKRRETRLHREVMFSASTFVQNRGKLLLPPSAKFDIRATRLAVRQPPQQGNTSPGDVNNAGTIQVTAATLADVVGDRRSAVVDGRCLEDDSQGTDRAGSREQPQEQPVEYERDVLPVFLDLHRRNTHGTAGGLVRVCGEGGKVK